MRRFWRVVAVASVVGAALWLTGLRLVTVAYSAPGLLFFALLAGVFLAAGAAASAPPRVGPSAAAGALAGTGAALITAAALPVFSVQSWQGWISSTVFLFVTQLALGAAMGVGGGFVARHSFPTR